MLHVMLTIPRNEVDEGGESFRGYRIVEWAYVGRNYMRVWLAVPHGSVRQLYNETGWQTEDTRVAA